MELINVTLFEPDKSIFKQVKNDKAECRKFFCERKDDCELYAKSQCINIGNMFSASCVYGKQSVETGFTKRARRYHAWIRDRKDSHKDLLYKLKSSPRSRFAIIGDYVFLPYAHMSNNKEVDFLGHGGAFVTGKPFIEKAAFNKSIVIILLKFRPMAMMGGEIKTYQEEQVPKFAKDLEDYMPELFGEVFAEYPRIKELADSVNYVGRKAVLSTLKPGIKVKKKRDSHYWLWDGLFLTTDGESLLFAIAKGETSIKIKPVEGATIEITDNDQVTEATEFVD